MFRVLLTGDTMGRPGRQVLEERLHDLRREMEIDLVVSNIENAAAGFSITPRIAQDLFAAGVDVMTSGNHIFDKKEVLEYIVGEPRLLRPANYAPGVPGRGRWTGRVKGVPVAVINLQGRVFMPPSDDPFRCAETQLAAIGGGPQVILVDFHAETTSGHRTEEGGVRSAAHLVWAGGGGCIGLCIGLSGSRFDGPRSLSGAGSEETTSL